MDVRYRFISKIEDDVHKGLATWMLVPVYCSMMPSFKKERSISEVNWNPLVVTEEMGLQQQKLKIP